MSSNNKYDSDWLHCIVDDLERRKCGKTDEARLPKNISSENF